MSYHYFGVIFSLWSHPMKPMLRSVKLAAPTASDLWANRLADVHAKAVVGNDARYVEAEQLLSTAENVVRYECAVLGATNHVTNNHVITEVGDDGQCRIQTGRESIGTRRPRTATPFVGRSTYQSLLRQAALLLRTQGL